MVTSFENMTVSLLLDDCLRCTVDIRIMGIHYARAEVFIFWHRYTKIGSRRLAAWYRLISFYVSRQSHVMWRESHFMCRPTSSIGRHVK